MDRINKLVQHEKFTEAMNRNAQAEKNRVFCKHGMEHSFDVARIAYILNLENNFQLSKSLIYAAALLHDIGRYVQYCEGVNHHEAGATIANEILCDVGFEKLEIEQIVNAILNHRNNTLSLENNDLNQIIYKADKLSRSCFQCEAYNECYWDETLKNKNIIY